MSNANDGVVLSSGETVNGNWTYTQPRELRRAVLQFRVWEVHYAELGGCLNPYPMLI
jgi:hypothetical protein